MKIRTITLEGFQSYSEPETVDLTGLNLVAIIGPNGSGKTSLLNAIEWCLYGRFRGDIVRSVISRGSGRAQVSVEFDLNENTYRVTRTRTASDRHEVVLAVSDPSTVTGWRELTEKNPAHADPAIVSLLGMDSATARSTWMIAQNDFGTFCELQPAGRRAVLAAAFGLDAYAALAERADAARANLGKRLDKATWHLETLQQRFDAPASTGPLANLDDEALVARAGEAEREAHDAAQALAALSDDRLDEALVVAQRRLDDFLRATAQAQQEYQRSIAHAERLRTIAAQQVDNAQRTWDEASQAVWKVEAAQERTTAALARHHEATTAVATAQEALATARAALASLEAERGVIGAQGMEIAKQVDTLQESIAKHAGQCFTCGQALATADADRLLATHQAHRGELLQRWERIGTQITSAEASIDQATTTLAKVKANAMATEQDHRREEAVLANIKRIAGGVDAAQRPLAPAQAALKDAEAAKAAIPEPARDADAFQQLSEDLERAKAAVASKGTGTAEREAIRARRDRARATERAVWAEQDARATREAERAALVEPLDRARAEADTLAKDLRTFEILRDAFRPNGIPAMILAGVVDEVNTEANDILADLAPSLGLNVTTQREKARGGTDDKVMVYVTTADGQVDYSTLSGSEKFRVALALRIALSRCIARRTGTPIETLVLDEGWGALDDEHKRAVQEVLVRLADDFNVYTVSHIEDVKDAFPTVIDVSKDDGTSRTTVITR